MDDIIERLNKIESTFGTGGVIIAIILAVLIVCMWTYLQSSIQKSAQTQAEESLKKFQLILDKELIKFTNFNQLQINSIHNCYIEIQNLYGKVKRVTKGDKFSPAQSNEAEIEELLECRAGFIKAYSHSRLLFTDNLKEKINKVLPTVDELIETYNGGLWELSKEEIELNNELNGGLHIAGIWSADAFDNLLMDLETVINQIEIEFQKMYGTHKS